MFGFVVANPAALTEEQLLRYRGFYCGLCRAIGRTYGMPQRLALNYDLTFLALLLSSLYELEETSVSRRCPAHPLTVQPDWHSEATEYAAAMNMLLAYHNCMDDWHDDHNPLSYMQASLFRKGAKLAAGAYSRQNRAIEACMQTLSQMEAGNVQEPDLPANAFGLLMEELFVWKPDHWEPLLRRMGHALGQFIYLMDAVLDLDKDLKSGSYNPLSSRAGGRDPRKLCQPVLEIYMGECTEAFEQLPLLQDLDLLRNILYSGVWTRFSTPGQKEAP